MEEKSRVFTIAVGRTLPTVLDLLTKRKAFAVIDASGDEAGRILTNSLEKQRVGTVLEAKNRGTRTEEPSAGKDGAPEYEERRLIDDDDGCFYELLAPGEGSADDDVRRLLFVGGSIHSRDDDDRVGAVMNRLAGLGMGESMARFPSIRELYSMAEGWSLRCQIYARDEEEAVQIWNGMHLGIGRDKGLYYMDHDRSLITLNLQEVRDGSDSGCATDSPSTLVDPAEFTAYDEILAKMIADADGTAALSIYGDDIFVEYSISHANDIVRCVVTEFFSNHNWRLDPVTLLVLRVKAKVSSGFCDGETLRFSHPTKATQRLSDGKRYHLQSITTNNDMKPKFYTGVGENKKPDTTVSADREWDNLVDFYLWLDTYRKEIELA